MKDEPILAPDGSNVFTSWEVTAVEEKQGFFFRRACSLLTGFENQDKVAGEIGRDGRTNMVYLSEYPLFKVALPARRRRSSATSSSSTRTIASSTTIDKLNRPVAVIVGHAIANVFLRT